MLQSGKSAMSHTMFVAGKTSLDFDNPKFSNSGAVFVIHSVRPPGVPFVANPYISPELPHKPIAENLFKNTLC